MPAFTRRGQGETGVSGGCAEEVLNICDDGDQDVWRNAIGFGTEQETAWCVIPSSFCPNCRPSLREERKLGQKEEGVRRFREGPLRSQ